MTVNGHTITLSEPLALLEVLRRGGWLADDRIAVEHNGAIVRREQWADTVCRDDDVLEVVHFVGGG